MNGMHGQPGDHLLLPQAAADRSGEAFVYWMSRGVGYLAFAVVLFGVAGLILG